MRTFQLYPASNTIKIRMPDKSGRLTVFERYHPSGRMLGIVRESSSQTTANRRGASMAKIIGSGIRNALVRNGLRVFALSAAFGATISAAFACPPGTILIPGTGFCSPVGGGGGGGSNVKDYTAEYLADYLEEKKNAAAPGSTLPTDGLTPLFQGTGANPYGTNAPVGGSHLGMYVSPGGLSSWGGAGGGAVSHSSYSITDTAGAVGPGTNGQSVRDVSGSGGIFGTLDASPFFGLPANQSLLVTGFFDFSGDSLSFGSVPGAAPVIVGNAGSIHADTYTFGGNVLYRFGSSYASGTAAYDFGHANEANGIAGSTGSFSTSGYSFDARLGDVLTLMNTSGASSSTMLTKSSRRESSGTFVGLDLSAHIGDSADRSAAFTDSSGFAFGSGESRSADVGGRARLFALFSGYGLQWTPYVSTTIDQRFAFSNTINIPSQAALPSGDLVSLNAARTFGGADLGVDAQGPNGWKVGVKGFYLASADTDILGGNIYLKIPFNYSATVGPRY